MGVQNSIYVIFLLSLEIPELCSSMDPTYEIETKQTCPYFYDKRYAIEVHGLVNCSWYSQKACCKITEVTSVFSNMYPLYEATKTCANMMNYLMCYFCSPEQYIWYRQRARVCFDFCETLYEECQGASYQGMKIGNEYENGSVFCEAQDFDVVEGNCFKFDPKVFDGAEKHINIYLPFISSLLMILSVLII